MRVKRQRLVAPDPGAAGPSNRGREEDPTYVPPRRLRGWECILLALHGTPCYTEGASMPIPEVRALAEPILGQNNQSWGAQHDLVRSLKTKGFVEKVARMIKMTPAGKLACDQVFARG
jgi:hypothetical protein